MPLSATMDDLRRWTRGGRDPARDTERGSETGIRRWDWRVLAVMLGLGAVLCVYDTRGDTLTFDEWDWALHRRGNSLATFLTPHNGHLSLVPLLIYRLLLGTAGLTNYLPYRLIIVALHLVCVALLFTYVRRALPTPLALAAAGALLFLGPAWQNFLWPFQLAWLISIAGGIGALLALDRHDRRGELVACVLTAISLASSGLGAAITAGLLFDILASRDRVKRLWVVVVPLVPYGLWWLKYQNESLAHNALGILPGFVVDGVSATFAALLGLSGTTIPFGTGTLLSAGRPLAAIAVIGLLILVWRRRWVTARQLTLAITVLAFWVSAGASRGDLTQGYDSRYLYVGAVYTLLLAAELARGVKLAAPITVVTVAVAVVAVVSNLGVFSDASAFQRAEAATIRTDLGALDIARPLIPAQYTAHQFFGAPAVQLQATAFFAAADADGNPGLTPAQISRQPANLRTLADQELIAAHQLALRPGPAARSRTDAARVSGTMGGTARTRGSCVAFTASAAAGAHVLELTLTSGTMSIASTPDATTVAIRRFGPVWQPLGPTTVGSDRLDLASDRSDTPWTVQITTPRGVRVCTSPAGGPA